MVRPSYGPQAKKQARQLLEALLTYANDGLEDCDHLKLECHWRSETQLIIKTKVRQLEALNVRVCQDGKLTSDQIKEALKRYQDFLEMLEDHRTKTQGADDWHFTLKLWFGRHEKAANLHRFDAEWERRRLEKSRQVTAATAVLQRGVEPLDDLVQSIRQEVSASIQARCGTMRVLDMSQPIELDAIYTTVNIYESISGRQRQGLTDLLQQFSLEAFTHLRQSQKIRLSGLAAVEQYSKLLVFGKPGAGKTAFLKWLAMQCNSGHLWAELIPVFITVKAFAEAKGQPELLSYIQKQWADCGVSYTQAEALLQQGRVLVLLDGLDEVRESDHDRVLQEMREFSTRFHTCLFVMSCRVAAQEYTFEQFTEVELADFDDQQITDFVTKWFAAKRDPTKTAQFLKQLHDQQQIRDLATSPLLLTLLCLVFQEANDFSANRAELYQEGLEVLLRKWDAKRNIERDGLPRRSDLYQKLSLQCKEALLSQVAFTTFERGDYFFKQQAVEQYIATFLHALPTNTHDESAPWEIDSFAVLKSIEAQHGLLVERARGIYSFSHLTFHEYFTAKKIADTPADQLKEVLQALASHVTEQAWQEVFLLTISMLPSADALLLLLKAQIDGLLSSDATLQSFLSWLNEKAIVAVNNPSQLGIYYKPAIVRAYYSFLILDSVSIKASAANIVSAMHGTSAIDKSAIAVSSDSDNEKAIASVISSARDNQRAIAIAIALASSMDSALETVIFRSIAVSSAMNKALDFTSDLALKQSLQNLKTQLPDPTRDQTGVKQWWKEHGHIWTTQLREAQIQYRNLVYDWQFSEAQVDLLDQYYRANLLLVDCLNSDCSVSQAVQDEIEATLLLSTKDIEQYQKNQK